MAKIEFILQQLVESENHHSALKQLLSMAWTKRTLLSAAFVNENGVKAIEPFLSGNVLREAYVGIRNGVTSLQGILALQECGIQVYAVDTASQAFIFHPKIYGSIGENIAHLVLGSANLTWSGLYNNIESSTYIELDLSEEPDKKLLEKVISSLEAMKSKFPQHCFFIPNKEAAIELFESGLLEDERQARINIVSSAKKPNPVTNAKSRMAVGLHPPPKKGYAKQSKTAMPLPQITGNVEQQTAAALGALVFGPLIWEKPSLPKGDLQLLTQGHGSGVLRLTQANFSINGTVINQTQYFRHEAFKSLVWQIDPSDSGKEIAYASFALVIGGVHLGTFELKISHKPAWEAGQGNYTTGLHWGDAVDLIRREGLIGRALRIYAPSSGAKPYIIEID